MVPALDFAAMDQDPLQTHQARVMAELGEALARLRDELAWTTQQLRLAQSATAEAEARATRAEDELRAIRASTTWRAGRAIVGPVAWLRGRR